jgi:SSS family solute:Na+ symporter
MNLYLVFFAIYVLIVVAIGVISSRKETEEDFMIAERKIKGVQMTATVSAAFFDSATLAIYVGYLYQFGFSAIWLFGGVIIGLLVLKRFVARIKQKADEVRAYSMPEYFYKVLGKQNGLMFSFFIIIQFFLFLTINFIVAGKVLSAIFPLSYTAAAAIGAVLVLTYLLMAGFKAVIRTDFFQLVITCIMALTVGVFLFGKTHLPTAELHPLALGWGNLIGFLILGAAAVLVAPDLWQRIFAARDAKVMKRAFNYAPIVIMVLAVVVAVIGLATKQFFPNIPPENALVTGFSQLLPYGLKELGMVLLYAVALSSSDTVIFVLSSLFTRDLKNYTERYSDESMKKLTRMFMIVMVAVAFLIAISYQNIVAIGLSFASLSLGLFPAVFGTLFWQLRQKAVFWSLAASLISVFVLWVSGQLNPTNSVIVLPVALISLFILQKVLKEKALPAVA